VKFRTRETRTPTVELTPLIDVVFLLLIFFMISTTFVSRTGLQIQLPEVEHSQTNPDRKRVEVMVTEDGGYLVDGEAVPADSDLESVLRARAEEAGEQMPLLVIRADRNARHAAVATAMDAGSAAGLGRMAISTVKPDTGKAE
jgi:biopolymer transport protein ExbD